MPADLKKSASHERDHLFFREFPKIMEVVQGNSRYGWYTGGETSRSPKDSSEIARRLRGPVFNIHLASHMPLQVASDKRNAVAV
jgi:hypothetical protein